MDYTSVNNERFEAAADAKQMSVKIRTRGVDLYYGDRQVLKNITFDMGENMVTAFIGPSGCGKSSYLRCLNRMNDFISSARVEGKIFWRTIRTSSRCGARWGWFSRNRIPFRCRYMTISPTARV